MQLGLTPSSSMKLIESNSIIIDKNCYAKSQKLYNKIISPANNLNQSKLAIPREILTIVRNELVQLDMTIERSQSTYEQQIAPLDRLIKEFKESRELNGNRRLNFKEIIPKNTINKNATLPIQPAPPQPPPQPPKMHQSVLPSHPKTQQSPRRHEKNMKMSSNTERAIRQPAYSNKMDVWAISQPFFSQLPSNEEIEKLFADCSSIPKTLPQIPEPARHWSVLMQEIINARKESIHLLSPPGPSASPHGISDFWATNQVNFPIEPVQKRNTSVFFYLLNSFVEIPPEDDPQENINETTIPSKRKQYLRSHNLAQHVPYDNYLSLPFSTRLDLELKSLDLDKGNSSSIFNERPFESDIRQTKEEIDNVLLPQLIETKQFIMDHIDEYRQDQVKRTDQIIRSKEMIYEALKRKNKK